MQSSVFPSNLRLYTALERLVTESRRHASVTTVAAHHEYDSKRHAVAFFINVSSQNGEE
jgi:hypothetical protein